MTMTLRNAVPLVAAALLLVSAAGCVEAPRRPPPEAHPAYLRALSDLREARWLIEHRSGQGIANADEHFAIEQINGAISDIRQAAFDDGKDANYAPPPDVPAYGPGRLHQAENILRRAHADVAREEDNDFAKGLRNRAIQHIDAAMQGTQSAIHDLQSLE